MPIGAKFLADCLDHLRVLVCPPLEPTRESDGPLSIHLELVAREPLDRLLADVHSLVPPPEVSCAMFGAVPKHSRRRINRRRGRVRSTSGNGQSRPAGMGGGDVGCRNGLQAGRPRDHLVRFHGLPWAAGPPAVARRVATASAPMVPSTVSGSVSPGLREFHLPSLIFHFLFSDFPFSSVSDF